MSLPVLYTSADVGRLLGKYEKWVRNQAHAGRINFQRVGKSYRFTEQDVTDYLATVAGPPKQQRVTGLAPRSRRTRAA